MKIIVITQNAPMYLPQFLDSFINKLNNSNHEIDSIVTFAPYNKSLLVELRQRLQFYGYINCIILSIYVIKNIILSYISNLLNLNKVYLLHNVFRKYNIKHQKYKSVNSKSFIEYIKINDIDLIISIAAPKIFKTKLLNAPRYGCINYHSALLPKYRGRQPLFWALYNDEKETGISIHEMNEKIDDGPLLIQEKFSISENDSLHSLYLKTLKIGPQALIKAVEIINQNIENRIENKANDDNYHSFPDIFAGKKFRKMGKHFF